MSSPPVGSRLSYALRVYGTDGERQGVAAGDVDADGIDDVILGDGGLAPLDGLRVMLATAHAGLQEPIVSGSHYQYVDHLQPVRLDGDRFSDLVSVGGTAEGDGSANPRAWVGDGHGRFRTTFAPEHPENAGAEMFTSPLDFDDDGEQDIVAWFYEEEPFIRFFRGAGDGTFRRAQVTLPVAPLPANPGIVAADVDGDHRTDLVLGGTDGPLVAFRRRSPSRFDLVKLVGSGVPVGSGDIDADGRDDVVVIADDSSRLRVALSGTETPARVPGVSLVRIHRGPSELGYVALGEIDGDGHTDIATLDDSLQVFTTTPATRSTRRLLVGVRGDATGSRRARFHFRVVPRPRYPARRWIVHFAARTLSLNARAEVQTCLTLPAGRHLAFLLHDGRTAAHAGVTIP